MQNVRCRTLDTERACTLRVYTAKKSKTNLTIPAERHRFLAIPVAKPLVMLARQHDVLGATLCKEISPLSWSVQTGIKPMGIVGVGKILMLRLADELCIFSILCTLPIPPEPFRSKCWDGEDSPMDEDAKFGFVVPRWVGSGIERLPRCLPGLYRRQWATGDDKYELHENILVWQHGSATILNEDIMQFATMTKIQQNAQYCLLEYVAS